MEKLSALLVLKDQLDAPASLASLAKPQQLTLALQANDRLKLYLTVLQQAHAKALSAGLTLPDLARECVQAGITDDDELAWLRGFPGTALASSDGLALPQWPVMSAYLERELVQMAAPVLAALPAEDPMQQRVESWLARLRDWHVDRLSFAQIADLTSGPGGKEGKRQPIAESAAGIGSLHVLVMDLHKRLNALAATLGAQGRQIDGAQVWGLSEDGLDEPRVAAFMQGLHRTMALKLDHPGLGTCATRDRDRLLIQNDIGTNDAHILVIQVETKAGHALQVRLTYSDLHRQRFEFFRQQMAQVGADWGEVQSQQAPTLNGGQAFYVGTAVFSPRDESQLHQQLEGIGERIVFLIDWNRARKRLQAFLDKAGALSVLKEAADKRWGHMAWLAAGGDRLVWNAMAAQGPATFRLGDRLHEVLGADVARDYLAELLELSHRVEMEGLTRALIADEARALLGRRLRQRHGEFDSLETQAGLAQALGQALVDVLTGPDLQADTARQLAERAKRWEHQADQLVTRAREVSERVPQGQGLVRLLERGDDVIDAMEEAAFVWRLVADHAAERPHRHGHRVWTDEVHQALAASAVVLLQATQDVVRAVSIARHLGETSERCDHDEFLAATWRVVQSERDSDELHRRARASLAADWRKHDDAVALHLGHELADALEAAGDALLVFAHALRERAFLRIDSVGA